MIALRPPQCKGSPFPSKTDPPHTCHYIATRTNSPTAPHIHGHRQQPPTDAASETPSGNRNVTQQPHGGAAAQRTSAAHSTPAAATVSAARAASKLQRKHNSATPGPQRREHKAASPAQRHSDLPHKRTELQDPRTPSSRNSRASNHSRSTESLGVKKPATAATPQLLLPGAAHDAEEAAPLGRAPETARTRIKQTEGSLYMQL